MIFSCLQVVIVNMLYQCVSYSLGRSCSAKEIHAQLNYQVVRMCHVRVPQKYEDEYGYNIVV